MDEDLRPLLFSGTHWFEALTSESPDRWGLWRITRSPEPAWWRDLLIAAARFAQLHGLLDQYRAQFEGIPVGSMTDSVGENENRSSVSPIWEVANELVVGFLLEHALGWELLGHEPPGHRGRIGEWEFLAPSGCVVFVEVKTLVEPAQYPPVFNRGVATGRLTRVLKGAYRQLPRDGRSTLVVVVGTGLILEASHGIYHSDLFQTLFGQIQITFQVLPYVEGSERMGPAFREMFVHQNKHRRLGAVAGLAVGGMSTPGLGFYVINNPFGDPGVQIAEADFNDTWRFWIDQEGRGLEKDGVSGTEIWDRIAESLS